MGGGGGGGGGFGAKQTRGDGRLDMRSSAVLVKKELKLLVGWDGVKGRGGGGGEGF